METTGRLLLPAERDGAAFDAVSAVMAAHDGWYDPDDDEWPITSLADLATVAGARVERNGEWLVLDTDEEGDPKWSDQATAFYVHLAPFVGEGNVLLSGEDGTEWSYTFADGAISQSGVNGWDGSTEPFGEPADEEPAVTATPAAAPKKRTLFRRR